MSVGSIYSSPPIVTSLAQHCLAMVHVYIQTGEIGQNEGLLHKPQQTKALLYEQKISQRHSGSWGTLCTLITAHIIYQHDDVLFVTRVSVNPKLVSYVRLAAVLLSDILGDTIVSKIVSVDGVSLVNWARCYIPTCNATPCPLATCRF